MTWLMRVGALVLAVAVLSAFAGARAPAASAYVHRYPGNPNQMVLDPENLLTEYDALTGGAGSGGAGGFEAAVAADGIPAAEAALGTIGVFSGATFLSALGALGVGFAIGTTANNYFHISCAIADNCTADSTGSTVRFLDWHYDDAGTTNAPGPYYVLRVTTISENCWNTGTGSVDAFWPAQDASGYAGCYAALGAAIETQVSGKPGSLGHRSIGTYGLMQKTLTTTQMRAQYSLDTAGASNSGHGDALAIPYGEITSRTSLAADPTGSAATAFQTALASGSDASDVAVLHALDPSYDPTVPDTMLVPDCLGETLAACTAAIDALGFTGTIVPNVADFDGADTAYPPNGAIVELPAPGATVDVTGVINVDLNPDTDAMPFLLPQPDANETYPEYLARLRELGWVGTATLTELSDALSDPDTGPLGVVRLVVPLGSPRTVTTLERKRWPSLSPKAHRDVPIDFERNPPGLPPAPPGPGPGCPGCPPPHGGGLDFTPITSLTFGCKFPFGLFCYAADVTGWFNVTAVPPCFDLTVPSVTVAGHTYFSDLHYVVDMGGSDMGAFNTYMGWMRTIIAWGMTIGTVYYVAGKLLGFDAAGDVAGATDGSVFGSD